MNLKIYFFVVLFVFIFNFLIVSPAIFKSIGLGKLGEVVYLFFSPICHQIDSRSLHFNGVKFAVCERCTFIYLGAFLGALLMPVLNNLIRKVNFLLIVAIIPSFFEFLLEKIFAVEIWVFKFLVSFWLGVLGGLVLTYQIVDMFSKD